MGTYLLVIGDRDALAWILTEQRMAFPAGRRLGVSTLRAGDTVYLVTTRSCYRNPTHDRTRVIGRATVASDVVWSDRPIHAFNRVFDRTCDLALESVAPFRTGLELAPLVADLNCFPNKPAWSMWMRRTLIPLSDHDAAVIAGGLSAYSQEPTQTVHGYVDWIRAHQA